MQYHVIKTYGGVEKRKTTGDDLSGEIFTDLLEGSVRGDIHNSSRGGWRRRYYFLTTSGCDFTMLLGNDGHGCGNRR